MRNIQQTFPTPPNLFQNVSLAVLFGEGKSKGKGKGTVCPRRGHEGPDGEYRNSSIPSLTSALDGVGGQRHVPAPLSPEKIRYPLYGRLSGPKGPSGRARKNSLPTEFDPQIVKLVASRHTD